MLWFLYPGLVYKSALCYWDRITLKEKGLQSVDPLPSYFGLVSRQHTVVRSRRQSRANLTAAGKERKDRGGPSIGF